MQRSIYMTLLSLTLSMLVVGTLFPYTSANMNDTKSIITMTPSNEDNAVGSRVAAEHKTPVTYTFPNSTVKMVVDSNTYKPGDNCKINASAGLSDMNYQVAWAVESPIAQTAYSLTQTYTEGVFDDPKFLTNDGNDTSDWTISGYASPSSVFVNTTGNYLVLYHNETTARGTIYIAQSNPTISGKFQVSFDCRNASYSQNNLVFSYYNGTTWVDNNIPGVTSSTFQTKTYSITLGGGETNNYIFRFYTDSNAVKSGFAIWHLTNFVLKYADTAFAKTGTGVVSNNIEHYWINQGINSLFNFSYVYQYSEQNSKVTLNITFTLPKDKIYLGDWSFKLILTNKDDQGTVLAPKTYPSPIRIEDELTFVTHATYIKRGTNSTTTYDLYERENITTLSPNDEYAYIGLLYYNSSSYPVNITAYSQIERNGNLTRNFSNKYFNITWGNGDVFSHLHKYNNAANDIGHGNITGVNLPENKSLYCILYAKIIMRGIFGNVTQNFSVKFPNLNPITVDGIKRTQDFIDTIPMPTIVVKYRVVLENEVLPQAQEYYLLDSIAGYFTVTTIPFNQTLSTIYNETTRVFTKKLTIPLVDIHYNLELFSHTTDAIITYAPFIQEVSAYTVHWKYTISARTNVTHNYSFRIHWYDAELFNNTNIAFVNHNTTSLPNFPLKIVGSFTITLPQNRLLVYQNEELKFTFTVLLDQKDMEIVEIPLYAVLDTTTAPHIIPSTIGNQYSISYSPSSSVTLGYHQLLIYTDTGYYLGSVQIEVQPSPTDSKAISYAYPVYTEFLALIAAVAVVAVFFTSLLRIVKKGK